MITSQTSLLMICSILKLNFEYPLEPFNDFFLDIFTTIIFHPDFVDKIYHKEDMQKVLGVETS